MTNSVPYCAVSVFTASDAGSVPSLELPPRLMFTTGTFGAIHSMPAMIAESGQPSTVHLAADQIRVRRHAPEPAVRGGSGAGDDPGDVRTVPDVVARVRAGVGEVLGLHHFPGQVGMVGLDSGVQYADRDALAGEAQRPCRRGTDLRHADVQRRVGPGVQPHLPDPGREAVRAGEPGPERAALALLLPYPRAVDARQRADRRRGTGGGHRPDPAGG